MRKHHPKNERIKRRYFAYLEEAKRMSASSVAQVAAAIDEFEASTGHRDFGLLHIEQARKFKRKLSEAINPATGEPLAKATTYSRLMAVKAFFVWLAKQPGYKAAVSYSDADDFNPSNNARRIAKATREKAAPTPEQIRHVLSLMPAISDIERRDKALLAFVILSGARDDAIASMLLRHVDLARRAVVQDARDVRTNNRKTFTSTFFPVGEEIEAIVSQWIRYLTCGKLFGPDDPLFPVTRIEVGKESRCFEPAGLERGNWSNAAAIRRICRQAFKVAGLNYFNPHSFRNPLAALGERLCKTPEEFKAWSQNLGHEQVLTTFTSYGAVASDRQADILNEIGRAENASRKSGSTLDKRTLQSVITLLQQSAG